MSNGFTNLPTSLLGAVNIGGNLVVQGTTRSVGVLSTDASLAVGVTPNITRVGNFTGYGPGISGNLALDAATRDNAGVSAALGALGANGNAQKVRRINAAGAALDAAVAQFFGTSFAALGSTADIAEHTVYTKTLPANLLGANGSLVVELLWQLTVLTASVSTIRVKLGGTVIAAHALAAAQAAWVRVYLANFGATNVQRAIALVMSGVANVAPAVNVAAIDTTANADLTVTLQNGNAGNVCEVDLISIKDGNSFGPV